MLQKVKKLFSQPAFRAQPIAVTTRCVAWVFCVATKSSHSFPLTNAGERVCVPANLRFTSLTTYILRDWAETELRCLDMFLRQGDTFLDIGANIGLFTLKAARIVGADGLVVCVEPGAAALKQLKQNLALNSYPHVRVVPKALSDTVGTAKLHHIELGNDPQAFSLIHDGSNVDAECVETTTLDALVEQQGMGKLHCIKMDVEGAEQLVIRSGMKSLVSHKPIVIFEVNAGPALYAGTEGIPFQMFTDMGYRIFRIEHGTLKQHLSVPPGPGNLVAIHPEGTQPVAARLN